MNFRIFEHDEFQHILFGLKFSTHFWLLFPLVVTLKQSEASTLSFKRNVADKNFWGLGKTAASNPRPQDLDPRPQTPDF